MTTTREPLRRRVSADSQAGGLRPTLDRVSQRAPRRFGQWAGSVLFVGLVVLGLVVAFRAQSDAVEVLVVKNPVPAGHVIDSRDLDAMSVSGVSGAILAENVDSVVGQRATTGLVEGQVLTDAAVTTQTVPADGERLVAVRLDKGRVPSELGPGQTVEILAVPPPGDTGEADELEAPAVLAARARIQHVEETNDGGVRVTVVVPDRDARRVAAHSATGRITVVQTPLASGE